MIAIDARQPTETPMRSPFDQCDVAPRALSCSHFFDSGTKSRMKNTMSAGSAPLIIRKRHPEFASSRSTIAVGIPMPSSSASTPPMNRCRPMLSRPTMRNPRFAAAPMSPAISARDLFGQISLTSATPSDHSPPMPSDAMNRSAAMCHASVANPHRPVKIAYVKMLSDIARTRPMRSPSQPKNTPPVAAPTRNTAMMAPNHCVACAG